MKRSELKPGQAYALPRYGSYVGRRQLGHEGLVRGVYGGPRTVQTGTRWEYTRVGTQERERVPVMAERLVFTVDGAERLFENGRAVVGLWEDHEKAVEDMARADRWRVDRARENRAQAEQIIADLRAAGFTADVQRWVDASQFMLDPDHNGIRINVRDAAAFAKLAQMARGGAS